MKVVTALKLFCNHCKFVKNRKLIYVRCPANPRHKQRQGRQYYYFATASGCVPPSTPTCGTDALRFDFADYQ